MKALISAQSRAAVLFDDGQCFLLRQGQDPVSCDPDSASILLGDSTDLEDVSVESVAAIAAALRIACERDAALQFLLTVLDDGPESDVFPKLTSRLRALIPTEDGAHAVCQRLYAAPLTDRQVQTVSALLTVFDSHPLSHELSKLIEYQARIRDVRIAWESISAGRFPNVASRDRFFSQASLSGQVTALVQEPKQFLRPSSEGTDSRSVLHAWAVELVRQPGFEFGAASKVQSGQQTRKTPRGVSQTGLGTLQAAGGTSESAYPAAADDTTLHVDLVSIEEIAPNQLSEDQVEAALLRNFLNVLNNQLFVVIQNAGDALDQIPAGHVVHGQLKEISSAADQLQQATKRLQGLVEGVTVARGSGVILVADDQLSVRKIVVRALEHAGYKVLECSNAVEALDVCKTYPGRIDLVLADVGMSPVDGYELVRQFLSIRRETKAIYMSGNYPDHRKTMAGTEFLLKPVELQGLPEKIRQVLNRP